MREKMQAAVLHAPGDVRIEDVSVPSLENVGVLLKVAAVGVCGSDVPRMLTKGAHKMPLICGHEFSGHVVEIQGDLPGLSVGDLVTVPPLIPCFKCAQCLQGNPSRCTDYDYFGSRRDGAYAEYVVVPPSNVMKVPRELDPAAAAIVDPAAVALHAIWKTDVKIGARVAVVGCGPIGLFAVQWFRNMGAREILAVDLSPMKLDLAKQAGATLVAIDSKEALAAGSFDVVLEAAGHPATVNLAVKLAGPAGEVVFIGIPVKEVGLEVEAFQHFLRQEVVLNGAWNSFSMPFPGQEWRVAVDELVSGRLQWKFMVTHDLPLGQLPETFAALSRNSLEAAKIIFRPSS